MNAVDWIYVKATSRDGFIDDDMNYVGKYTLRMPTVGNDVCTPDEVERILNSANNCWNVTRSERGRFTTFQWMMREA